jgi:hypothetical protein
MVKIITFLIVVSLSYQCSARPEQKQKSTSEELTIKATQCKPATSIFRWRLGSDKIVIKGRKGDKCELTVTNEVEGGYKISECRIPISLKELKISVDRQSNTIDNSARQGVRYSPDISEYCTVVKTGNLLEDLKRNRKS